MNKLLQFQKSERDEAARLGLTLNAFHLFCLVGLDSGKAIKYYAGKMGVSHQAISAMIDGLELAGYVMRGKTIKNKSVVILSLGDKGKIAIGEIGKPKGSET